MDDSLGPFKGNCLFVIDLDKGVDRIAKLARGVETGAAQEIAEIEERIARYVRMLAQEAGEGGIGGKVGLVGEKGRAFANTISRLNGYRPSRLTSWALVRSASGCSGTEGAGCARAAVVSTAASKIRDKFTPGNTPDRPSG